jgi:hypothetical protein
VLAIFDVHDEYGYEFDTVILIQSMTGNDLPFYSWSDTNSYYWSQSSRA